MLNGGPASLVYGTMFAGLGSTCIAMSLAEMASIDPTVGAQYRWSAKFAPAFPRFFGLVQGWLTTFAWIFTVSASQAICSYIITALIIFNNEDYVLHRWHTSLIICCFILLSLLPNLWFRTLMKAFELTGGVCCFMFFIIHIIVLSTLGSTSSNKFVWGTLFHEAPGWSNPGIAWCLGLLAPTSALIGIDGVLHMSDEVKHVKTRVPYSMVSSMISNFILQFAFVICLLYKIGDINTVLNDTTGLAIVQVYYQATKSKIGTSILMAMLLFMMFFCLCNNLVSVSRLTYAFARDRGLPFSNFFSVVHPRFKVPLNALLLICTINFLISLINISSSTAFNAILSLCTLGIMLSYILPISFFLFKKIMGHKIEYGPWRLGRWGIPVNIFALCFAIFQVFWTPWPSVQNVTAETINYAGPVLVGMIIGALIDWAITGRKRFDIPVPREVPLFY